MTVHQNLEISPATRPASDAERSAVLAAPGFGATFTDHMVTMHWSEHKGWGAGKVSAFQPIQMSPAAAVIHYGQQVFEGLKAFRHADGDILLFRVKDNAARLQASAARLAIPPLPTSSFVEAVEALVRIDHRWVPDRATGTLYIRPFIFASEPFLGVRPAAEFTFCVIASPVGDYFAGGQRPIRLWVSPHYARVGRRGTGAAKCAGNYAASLIAQAEATANGCDQTLFLDAAEDRWVEELGGMNIFFVRRDGSLTTPPLGGTILPGITRDTIIQLARDFGMTVDERPCSYEEMSRDAASGEITEAFACGTAAVIAPIGSVKSSFEEIAIGSAGIGPITARLRERLVDLQFGTETDPYQWVTRVSV